jgi:hypothetical protein
MVAKHLPIQYLGADAVPCTHPRASGHPYPRISRHAYREIPMANNVPLSTNQQNHNTSHPLSLSLSRARALSCPWTLQLSDLAVGGQYLQRALLLHITNWIVSCAACIPLPLPRPVPSCLPACRFLVLSPGEARCSLARCSSEVALVPKSHQLSFFFALPCSISCIFLSVLAIYKHQRGREGERGN